MPPRRIAAMAVGVLLLLLLLLLLPLLAAAAAASLTRPLACLGSCPPSSGAAAAANSTRAQQQQQHMPIDDDDDTTMDAAERERRYVTSTFVRLAAMHSCSGRYVSAPGSTADDPSTTAAADDPADGRRRPRSSSFPYVPEDSVAILEAIAAELEELGAQDVRFDGVVLTATLPARPPPPHLDPHAQPTTLQLPPSSPFSSSSSSSSSSARPVALIAHVDQSCAFPGRVDTYWLPKPRKKGSGPSPRVKPRVFPRWDGSPIAFPDAVGPHVTLRLPAEEGEAEGVPVAPGLAGAVNQTLITGSGASPLGADGVAGAVAMLALARRWALAAARDAGRRGGGEGSAAAPASAPSPAPAPPPPPPPATMLNLSLGLGPVRLVFVPAGELHSARSLLGDRARAIVGADVAFMLDAERRGDVRYEAPLYAHYAVRVDAHYRLPAGMGAGRSPDFPSVYGLARCHPPSLVAQVVARVAESRYACDVSDGREPSIEVRGLAVAADHSKPSPTSQLRGGVAPARSTARFVVRAFDEAGLQEAREFLDAAVRQVADRPPASKGCASLSLRETRRNERSAWVLGGRDAGPVRLARAAMRAAGLQPASTPLRTLTEASVLSELGVHTTLLYSAWHAAHGPLEWTTAEEMVAVADVAQALAGLWARYEGSGLGAGGGPVCPVGAAFDADPSDADGGPAP
jgi:di/tripeptidase